MRRIVTISAMLLVLVSCTAAPERERFAPLPDTVTPQPYGRLLERARALASQATDSYYLNDWEKVEQAAEGLAQTANYLSKATDVPPRHADTIKVTSTDLGKLASQLQGAARAKDVKKTNDAMGLINAKVREMRLGDPMPPAKEKGDS